METRKLISYKTLRAELDETLARLQDPATDVDEALKLYERGQKVADELTAYLKKAEAKIQKIKKTKES